MPEHSQTPAAIRQRRYRERLRSGAMHVSLDMPPGMIDRLTAAGYISPCWLEDDRQAVAQAALNALDDYLRH